MDMGTGKTDELIKAAIAGLPRRGPSAGFRARVMAAIEAQAAADARLDWAVKAAGALTAAWAALVGLLAAGPVYGLVSGYAALAMEGGVGQALRLLGARGALLLAKAGAAVSFAGDLAAIMMTQLPPFYEVAAAALISAAVIRTVAQTRPAAQRI